MVKYMWDLRMLAEVFFSYPPMPLNIGMRAISDQLAGAALHIQAESRNT